MWEFLVEHFDLVEDFKNSSYTELTAVTALILYVYFATRQKLITWLFGLIGVTLFFIIDYRAQLYAQLPLGGIYFLMNFYGWYEWKFGGKNRSVLPVSRTSLTMFVVLITLGTLGTLLIGSILTEFSNSDVPFWDGGTTAFSLVGTWMLARKKLENWVLWFVVDSIYIGLYLYKSLAVSALLYLIYVVFSVVGFINWYYSMKYTKDPQ